MTLTRLPRRRFLQIAAAAPVLGLSSRARAAAPIARWSGTALGAKSQILICGVEQHNASDMLQQVVAEIDRLEGIFSLYQPNSELARLNRDGHLRAPSPEFLDVLSLSRAIWQHSYGAFDPTVQSTYLARMNNEDAAPQTAEFGDVAFAAHGITLTKPGMKLTFNGVAQGYITDRLADLLSGMGLRNLAVSAGETRALGLNASQVPWRVGIQSPTGQIVKHIHLQDRALATSAPAGTLLPDGSSHIIDARSVQTGPQWNVVSVESSRAAVADALSTAACCLQVSECTDMLSHFEDAILAFRK